MNFFSHVDAGEEFREAKISLSAGSNGAGGKVEFVGHASQNLVPKSKVKRTLTLLC